MKNKNRFDLLYPTFKKDINGMTILNINDFENFMNTFSFSDSLIVAEKFRYTKCVEDLAQIKYDDFLTLDGTDKLKTIDCDFTKLLYTLKENVRQCEISNISINEDNAFVILKTSNLNDNV